MPGSEAWRTTALAPICLPAVGCAAADDAAVSAADLTAFVRERFMKDPQLGKQHSTSSKAYWVRRAGDSNSGLREYACQPNIRGVVFLTCKWIVWVARPASVVLTAAAGSAGTAGGQTRPAAGRAAGPRRGAAKPAGRSAAAVSCGEQGQGICAGGGSLISLCYLNSKMQVPAATAKRFPCNNPRATPACSRPSIRRSSPSC